MGSSHSFSTGTSQRASDLTSSDMLPDPRSPAPRRTPVRRYKANLADPRSPASRTPVPQKSLDSIDPRSPSLRIQRTPVNPKTNDIIDPRSPSFSRTPIAAEKEEIPEITPETPLASAKSRSVLADEEMPQIVIEPTADSTGEEEQAPVVTEVVLPERTNLRKRKTALSQSNTNPKQKRTAPQKKRPVLLSASDPLDKENRCNFVQVETAPAKPDQNAFKISHGVSKMRSPSSPARSAPMSSPDMYATKRQHAVASYRKQLV
eukprot:TRINITY_DN2693_c0_g1_i1.p1 TRINITY_DN2693_c0_g1~~TRINITY_DN2693_c0_g1_i1.p1  ORF type:complete len:272 (-),score=41.94 TRINITY_DN2693_c0_g1_i1:50-835(-)